MVCVNRISVADSGLWLIVDCGRLIVDCGRLIVDCG